MKGIIVHKLSLTSKRIHATGMKTEPVFPDVYLDFIKQHGIQSALQRQRGRQIHRDLVITDQWTEPQSAWQNSAEINGVNYLKSHAQELLDRTGAPD